MYEAVNKFIKKFWLENLKEEIIWETLAQM
jgi:hypothetical protein